MSIQWWAMVLVSCIAFVVAKEERTGSLRLALAPVPPMPSNAAPPRALEQKECNSQLNSVLPPLTISKWWDCVSEKANTTDMTIVGSDAAIKAECWCQHNVKNIVQDLHCCDDPDWSVLCEMDCNDDCSSPKAKECLRDCPAICLEIDYAPQGCNCTANKCSEHLLCIVEQGRNKTMAGEHDPVCDDRSFASSESFTQYYECMLEQPMRTVWQRHNSQHHCICNNSLPETFEQHSCCGSLVAQPICEQDCLPHSNCSSAEALQCKEDCKLACKHFHPNSITPECYEKCFHDSSTCAKYASCEPAKPLEFEYLCEDGSKPFDNGCCANHIGGGLHMQTCPSLCNFRRHYFLAHGQECQCFECPTSIDEINQKANEKLIEQIWDHGQELLADISSSVGLKHGASRTMQELMTKRNNELKRAIDGHTGPYNDVLQQKLNQIQRKWNERILREAQAELACERNPAACPVSDSETKESGLGIAIIIVIIVVVGLMLVFGIVVMLYLVFVKRKPNTANPQTVPPGDANVVVGRPVGEDTTGNEQPNSGTPMPTGKGEEPSKA